MPGLVANSTYYAKLITVDKQGNQAISSQSTIDTDAVHNADVHPDLQQNFQAFQANAQQITNATGGSAQIIFTTQLWNSGSGSYSVSTGNYTVGQTGKLFFDASAIIFEIGMTDKIGTFRLGLQKNGGLYFLGPAAGVAVIDPYDITYLTCGATISGSISVLAGDLVSVWAYWTGWGASYYYDNDNTWFEGRITPG